jgi:hypothetical protein
MQVFPTRNVHLVAAFPTAQMDLSVSMDMPLNSGTQTWTDLINTAHGVPLFSPIPPLVTATAKVSLGNASPTGISIRAGAVGTQFYALGVVVGQPLYTVVRVATHADIARLHVPYGDIYMFAGTNNFVLTVFADFTDNESWDVSEHPYLEFDSADHSIATVDASGRIIELELKDASFAFGGGPSDGFVSSHVPANLDRPHARSLRHVAHAEQPLPRSDVLVEVDGHFLVRRHLNLDDRDRRPDRRESDRRRERRRPLQQVEPVDAFLAVRAYARLGPQVASHRVEVHADPHVAGVAEGLRPEVERLARHDTVGCVRHRDNRIRQTVAAGYAARSASKSKASASYSPCCGPAI